MSERKLAKGWCETVLAGPGGPACAIHFRVVYNNGKHFEWYPYALAPDKCFAPEPEFKVDDWVAVCLDGEYGRVVTLLSEGDFPVGIQTHRLTKAHYYSPVQLELIERHNPCGK